ncbi:hypothetical protein ACLOJK_002881 [Asimina triloba]
MAFRKSLAHRLYSIAKASSSSSHHNSAPANTFLRKLLASPPPACPDDAGFFRRLLQKRAIFQSAAGPTSRECLALPVGDKLVERLRSMNGERLRLEGFVRPSSLPPKPGEADDDDGVISVEDARKLMRISRLEALKSALRREPRSCVSYSEFVQTCSGCLEGSSPDEVSGLIKMLDQSGIVIVLGNVVFLRPEQISVTDFHGVLLDYGSHPIGNFSFQVAKVIESLIPVAIPHPNDPRREELEEMERTKAEIDLKAENLVRRELWFGLCFLVAQTAGFMRLTFWELSWDVMEPICFYLTSIYFMAGYAFFLRTAKDPSFEGFFESRFVAKQRRLMKQRKFDVGRFNELRRAFDLPQISTPAAPLNCPRRTLLGAMHS